MQKLLDDAFLESLDTMDLNVVHLQSGILNGARLSRSYGSSLEFADYREYIPGDDLRRIDWNAAGRLDKFLIKRFIDEKQGKNCVYLDGSASMSHPDSKRFTALRMAAALGYLSVANLDSVSYRLLCGNACKRLGDFVASKGALLRTVEQMEDLLFQGETDLYAAILHDPSPGSDDGITYIISDLLTESNWRSAVDLLLTRKREVVLIQILTEEELRPNQVGRMTFKDAEQSTQLTLEVDRDMLDAYEETAKSFLLDIQQFCASRGIAYLRLKDDEAVEKVLRTRGCIGGVVQ